MYAIVSLLRSCVRGAIISGEMNLPAHYSIEGVCAACRCAIKTGDDRYRIGDGEYHADCFDISRFGDVVPGDRRG